MEKKRKVAQLGLALAVIILIGCLAVLFFQDRAAASQQDQTGPDQSQVEPKL